MGEQSKDDAAGSRPHRPVPPDETCNALTGRGWLCRNRAGKGTDHPGHGRCKYHGGSSPRRHGVYSKTTNKRIQQLIEELAEEGADLDATHELRMARANLIQWIDEYEQMREALLHWNETREPEERPVQVPEMRHLTPQLEAVSRIIYRIEKVKSDQHIGRGQLERLMLAMGRVVEHHASEEQTRRIRDDWVRIEIP